MIKYCGALERSDLRETIRERPEGGWFIEEEGERQGQKAADRLLKRRRPF